MNESFTVQEAPASYQMLMDSQHVRQGYRQTEVGVIPEDWKVAQLRDGCSKITDGTHDTPKPVNSGVPFLTAIHVKDNWIDFESCLYLTEAEHEVIYNRCNPQRNDVLKVVTRG